MPPPASLRSVPPMAGWKTKPSTALCKKTMSLGGNAYVATYSGDANLSNSASICAWRLMAASSSSPICQLLSASRMDTNSARSSWTVSTRPAKPRRVKTGGTARCRRNRVWRGTELH